MPDKKTIYKLFGVAAGLVAFYYLRAVVLPFVVGLFIAYLSNPLIEFYQRFLKRRGLAAISFMVTALLFVAGIVLAIAGVARAEFTRLSDAFHAVLNANKESVDAASAYIIDAASSLMPQKELPSQQELLAEGQQLVESEEVQNALADLWPTIQEWFSGVGASGGDQTLSAWAVFFGGLGYAFFLLFDYKQLIAGLAPYFAGKNGTIFTESFKEAEQTFGTYFRARLKIVAMLTVWYMLTFWLIGIPGGLLLGLLVGLLGFVPYLQYIGLLPLALGCVVLTLETGNHFLIYAGLVLGVYAIATLLEEFVLIPWLLKEASALYNSTVMILAIAVWGYLFGLAGVLLALPLTQLLASYIKRLYLPAQEGNSSA